MYYLGKKRRIILTKLFGSEENNWTQTVPGRKSYFICRQLTTLSSMNSSLKKPYKHWIPKNESNVYIFFIEQTVLSLIKSIFTEMKYFFTKYYRAKLNRYMYMYATNYLSIFLHWSFLMLKKLWKINGITIFMFWYCWYTVYHLNNLYIFIFLTLDYGLITY